MSFLAISLALEVFLQTPPGVLRDYKECLLLLNLLRGYIGDC